MIDVKIKNDDVVRNSSGRYETITGQDALFQRAFICAAVNKGSFIYDRQLGSRLGGIVVNAKNAKDTLDLIINEALVNCENTSAEVLRIGSKLRIRITVGDKSREEEVQFNGKIQ